MRTPKPSLARLREDTPVVCLSRWRGSRWAKLVVALPLDAYPPPSHPLEHIVFSGLERELEERHGVRVALTQDAYLLELVRIHVYPHHAEELDRGDARGWEAWCREDPSAAAQHALACLDELKFPLDWRRSRAEAWRALREVMVQHDLDGPVILLDELGLFLAGKDRAGLNADAAFLQYLAQLTNTERCWLVCVTQRGLEEAGDLDRRTLRQLRDRFRTGLVLDLAELGWVVEHKLVRARDPDTFSQSIARVQEEFRGAYPDLEFSAEELRRSYPLNPLALHLLQRAAETALSRARSVVRVLQEAGLERGWLDRPARGLLTPDAMFGLLREELAHRPEGRAVLRAAEAVEGLVEDLPGAPTRRRAGGDQGVVIGRAGRDADVHAKVAKRAGGRRARGVVAGAGVVVGGAGQSLSPRWSADARA